jgi:putative addiction module component (TIGR02574 family)
MTPLAQSLTHDALSLPPLDRAGLIEELLASFDRQSRLTVDTAWAEEAERRIDAYDSGVTASISLAESKDRINRR